MLIRRIFNQSLPDVQRAKVIYSKWAKILLFNFGLFQQVFDNLKLNKDMYQKSMKGVIGSYLKFKELYPWPKQSSNISFKKVIGNVL